MIGNPVLVNKTSVLQNRFNRVATSGEVKPGTKNIDTVGDTFENTHSVTTDEEREPQKKEMKTIGSHKPVQSIKKDDPVALGDHDNEQSGRKFKDEDRWQTHPLENG